MLLTLKFVILRSNGTRGKRAIYLCNEVDCAVDEVSLLFAVNEYTSSVAYRRHLLLEEKALAAHSTFYILHSAFYISSTAYPSPLQ